jgi:hypothetical protein
MPVSTSSRDRALARRPIEQEILYALYPYFRRPRLWRVDRLARYLKEPDINAPLEVLRGVGLVQHAPDGRIFASPAAAYLIELVGPVC